MELYINYYICLVQTVCIHRLVNAGTCKSLCSRCFMGRIKNKRSEGVGQAIARKMREAKNKAPTSKPYIFASLSSASGS